VQAKLLQAIQDKKFTKVGSTKLTEVDVRIIAATNRELENMVENGSFRKDLYYRINVIPIYLPPLRERIDDIEPISKYIIERINNKYGFKKSLSQELIELFKTLKWEGNVRELENVIERLLVKIKKNDITKEDFIKLEKETNKNTNFDAKQLILNCEKEVLIKLIASSKTTKELAKKLGVSKATAIRKLKQHNILFYK
jgi:transcriptional regulator with PAS, ATPase and Fis domain